ncbi:MAG: hypothetical protein Q9219_002744 [cf. Caloplaca sp. 3 TL-2023]
MNKGQGVKRKASNTQGQSNKKGRHLEDSFPIDPLLQRNASPTKTEDINLDSNSNDSSSDQSEDGSDHGAAAETPLTPFSPDHSPRFPSELKTHLCTYADCGKAFNRPAKLAQHLLSHTNVRPFICPHEPCTKDFLRQSHLQHHIKSAHSNIRDYICKWEGCGKSFITATRLKRHHAAHEGRQKFMCKVDGCGQTFRKHGTLQKHIATAHEGKKAFQCTLQDEIGNLCGQGFDTSGKLRAHEGRAHGGKRFWCSLCSAETSAKEIPIAQPSGLRVAGFSTYAQLQEHIKINHPPQCDQCGYICRSQRDLKNHVEIHHGQATLEERKTYPCPEHGCSRAFTKQGNLNAHIQSAHKAKRYICGKVELQSLNRVDGWDGLNACGRALSTKGSLESHIRTAHMGMGRRRSRKSKTHTSESSQDQQSHQMNLMKLTGVGYEQYSGRHVTCLIPHCDFRFGRKFDLQVHLVSRHNYSEREAEEIIADADKCLDQQITYPIDPPIDLIRGKDLGDLQLMDLDGLNEAHEEAIPVPCNGGF